MTKHQNQSSTSTEQHQEKPSGVLESVKRTGLIGESLERMMKAPPPAAAEVMSSLHHNAYLTKTLKYLSPLTKLLDLLEANEIKNELCEEGHSQAASYIGAGAAVLADSAVYMGGSSLVFGGVLGAEIPGVGLASISGGVFLMSQSAKVGNLVKHSVPFLVDMTLDTCADLYSCAAQFVHQSYQKWLADPLAQQMNYPDLETAMLQFGYKEYARVYVQQLDQQQQLLYGKVTRDLFSQQFQLNTNQQITAEKVIRFPNVKETISPEGVKKDINAIQAKLIKETEQLEKNNGHLHTVLKKSGSELDTNLNACVVSANKMPAAKREQANPAPAVKSYVQNAYQFCETYQAASQGVALVAHLAGNNRIAQQISTSAVGVSQVVMGIAQIAQNGWAMGPVGMVLGGMNALISCFGAESGSGMQALMEQLTVISQQIHALHEDMLQQFSRVFTALGVINTNIIEGFKLLHKDQTKMFAAILQLQKSVSVLQDSVNAVGSKVDSLSVEWRGYVLDADRKQLQFVLNGVRERARRPFVRAEQHTEVMAAFKSYNEEPVVRQLSGAKVTPADISKSLTTKLGSAEANTGLLLNYARNWLGLEVKTPIADPEQWRQSAELLIQMTNSQADERHDLAVLGKQDYEDFKHLKAIGDHWLALINQFKNNPGQASALMRLFDKYRFAVRQLQSLVENKIHLLEQENKNELKPAYKGIEEFEKQHAFKFELKRNNWFSSFLEDYSYCKGFHNGPRVWEDRYVSEWLEHSESRQKEIKAQLSAFRTVVEQGKADYERESVFHQLFAEETDDAVCSAPSVFMRHESAPDTMPLLPLPFYSKETSRLAFHSLPRLFLQAEQLNLGAIHYVYRLEKDALVYTVRFHMLGERKPITIQEIRMTCTNPNYLNPAEAAWHAYMGGTYPNNESYSRVTRQTGTPNNDYFYTWSCAMPTIAAQPGVRNAKGIEQWASNKADATSKYELVADKVKQKLQDLRQAANQQIIQELESLDARNPLANALLEVDASAKMLIAFISILCRNNYQPPAAVWTRDEVLHYLKGYTGHGVYLHHQLATNLDVLDTTEHVMLEHIASQTESAYTPLQETLKKLAEFMQTYEAHVQDEQVLAAQERIAQSSEAMMFGAAQTALILQSELIQSGHIAAAEHLSTVFKRVGFNPLALMPAARTEGAIAYGEGRFFPQLITGSAAVSSAAANTEGVVPK